MIEPRFMKLQIYIYFEIESLIHTKVKWATEFSLWYSEISK